MNGSVHSAILGSGIAKHFVEEVYCGSLVTVGKPFFSSSVSFVLPVNSSMIPIIDWGLLKLHEDDALPSLDDVVKKCDATTPGPVTIVNELFYTVLIPGMIVLTALIVVRLLQLGIRWFRSRRDARSRVRKLDIDHEEQAIISLIMVRTAQIVNGWAQKRKRIEVSLGSVHQNDGDLENQKMK